MNRLNIYGGSYMITSRANLENSASGDCVIHVSECVGVHFFPRVNCPHPTNQLYVRLETKRTRLAFMGVAILTHQGLSWRK